MQLLVEPWDAPDGAGWPAGWTATNGGLSIEDNRGAITPAIGTSYQTTAAYHSLVAENVDLTITFRLIYGPVIGFRDRRIHIGLRTGTVMYPDASDLPLVGYVLKLYMHPDYEGGWYLCTLHKFDGSASSVDPQVPPPGQGGFFPPVEENVEYRVRFQIIGDRIRARVWRADAQEPTTWLVDWRETGEPLPAGHPWLGVVTGWDGGNGTDPGYRFDDLIILRPTPVRVWNGTTEVPTRLRVV